MQERGERQMQWRDECEEGAPLEELRFASSFRHSIFDLRKASLSAVRLFCHLKRDHMTFLSYPW